MSDDTTEPTQGESPGDVIDRFTLVEQVGEGGMGTVWMAEQREPVERRVALKIIKLGMDTKEVVSRFEAERQALALMDHPHIAKVIDGGSTSSGRPYFVMELVEGVPITDFCNDQTLGLRERLDLFVKVCDAIQHAHLKGIIHRDIKPSNVLVAMQDGVPAPKVIDFGIAKATSAELTQQTLFTQLGTMVGTPEYMAPEQADPSGTDIDSRADVYSLGVLLYELLTGTKPFNIREVLEKGYQELLRTIREDDPAKPSTRVSTHLKETPIEQSDTNIDKLARRLRGDLDWIVMRALEKDRARRYETANAFAADVSRFLDGQPVLAAPPSRMYRMRKLVRRNRTVSVTISLFLLSLIGGLAGTGYGLWLSVRAEERAVDSEADARLRLTRAEEVTDVIENMLLGVGPQVALGRDTRLLEAILESTGKRADSGALEDPLVAAEIHKLLGFAYSSLRKRETALHHLAESGRLYDQELGPWSLGAYQVLVYQGQNLHALGRSDEAVALLERTLASLPTQDVRGDAQRTRAHCVTATALAKTYVESGRSANALEVLGPTLEFVNDPTSPVDSETGWQIRILHAQVLKGNGDLEVALQRVRTALEGVEAEFPEDHPTVLQALELYHDVLTSLDRRTEALTVARRLAPASRRIYGDGHEATISTWNRLAGDERDFGDPRRAAEMFEQVLEWQRARTEKPNNTLLVAAFDAALAYTGISDYERASSLLTEIRSWCKANPELGSPALLVEIVGVQGRVAASTGDFDAAEPAFREIVRLRSELLGESAGGTVSARAQLGRLLLQLRRLDEGIVELEACVELGSDLPPALDDGYREALSDLIQIETSRRNTDTARGYAIALRDRLRIHVESGETDPAPLTQLARLMTTGPSKDLHDFEEAIRLAERAIEITNRQDPQPFFVCVDAHTALGNHAAALTACEEARDLFPEGSPSWQMVEAKRVECAKELEASRRK